MRRTENPTVHIFANEYNALLEVWDVSHSLIEKIKHSRIDDEAIQHLIERIEQAHYHYVHARNIIEGKYGPKFERERHNA